MLQGYYTLKREIKINKCDFYGKVTAKQIGKPK